MSRLIGNRYQILSTLDSDQTTVTFVCRDEQLSDDFGDYLVMIKVLLPQDFGHAEAQAQFRNEIMQLRAVANPFVIRLYDHLMTDEMEAYAMECASGGDLAEALAQSPLPIPVVVTMLGQLLYGLQGIHDAGIMLRGIVPEHIRFSEKGAVKICDFSRATPIHAESPPPAVAMPVAYTSPEFLRHGEQDVRSDLYAVGVLAYEALTGELPFEAASLAETLAARLHLPEICPELVNPNCPPELNDWVMTLLQPDPSRRFQSAHEASRALSNTAALTTATGPLRRTT